MFFQSYDLDIDDSKSPNYYAKESVGIATGMLISSLHLAGLSVLTYTPSRMQFLTKMLDRPKNEKLFMLLLVGLPSDEAMVPVISKKSLSQVLTIYDDTKLEN